MGLNILQCDQACTDCIKSYKKKHDLHQGDKFKVPCNGIPKEYVNTAMSETMGGEDLREALAMLDPVTWAADILDWHCSDPVGEIWKRKTAENSLGEVTPYKDEYEELVKQGKSAFNRPYQKVMLRCSSKRKVFRLGRQCVPGDTKITMSDGSLKKIKDIIIGEEVLSVDPNTFKYKNTNVLDIFSTGKKDQYKIHTLQGHSIIVSDTHPFLVKEGIQDIKNGYSIIGEPGIWKTIRNGLKVKDRIAIASGANPNVNIDNKDYSDEQLRTLGYFLSDGHFGERQTPKFTNTNLIYLYEWEKDCKILGTNSKWYKKGNGFDLVLSNGHSKINPVRNWFTSLGFHGKTRNQRGIPDLVFKLSKRQVGLLINRLWSGDGWVEITTRKNRGTQRCSLGIGSESTKLLNNLKGLLLKFGINSYIRQEPNTDKTKHDFYKLHISKSTSILNFFELTGYIFGKEQQSIQGISIANISKKKDKVTHENDVDWDFINKIEKLDSTEMFDISLDHVHSFIAESSFVLKNCGKTETLCIAILHALFTNNDFRAVVITPYQTQIELIFNRLSKMIRESNTVKSSIHRYVKAPNYTIELKNGSTVRGFTAGTKSGGNADAVRGQKANMLVLDEADYLSAEDIGSALAIITNYPDATTWMSSTPTGKREKFYDACHSVLWKEYHFPSMVNPLWGPELEEHFRNEYTEIQYSHEVLATFGEQEQGVFQAAFIDDAKTDYRYEDRKLEGWVYSIGVDWNDQKIGTTMSVVGYNPSNCFFRVFNRYTVSRDGWTQHAAIEKIIELNRYWLPKSIYIDKGYGHAQYEIIRKYGLDSLSDVHKGHGHPDSRLQKITKQFDFGSKLTIKDPFTKQDVDKAAKPFLVENAVRRFEQRVIQFSKYDTQLESELRGYIIDHTTISGSPVYKQGNEKVGDHNLDALNLALIAFTLEGSQFGKVNYETHIAFSPTSIGQKTGIASLPGRPNETPQAGHEKNMPSMDRTTVIENKPVGFGNTPAANMNDGQRKLWSWPGFERDAPRPMRRMPGGMSGGRSGPPVRKKI